MAGRNPLPPHHHPMQVVRDLPYGRVPLPHPFLLDDPRLQLLPARPHHPPLVEDPRLAPPPHHHHHHQIQSLLIDNQRLAATHVALKQELAAAQLELRHVSAAAAKIKAERDAQVRDVYESSLKLEDEVRSVDAMAAELAQVRSDVQKLTATRQDLSAQLQTLTAELSRTRAELQQVPSVKAELESMQKELQRGRCPSFVAARWEQIQQIQHLYFMEVEDDSDNVSWWASSVICPWKVIYLMRAAVDYEKKAHADNLVQSQAMEKNMISMAREVEKLRAELANAEKRARAAAAAAAAANPGPGYAGSYGNPEIGYGGSTYADTYAMYQVQAAAEGSSQYGSGAVSHGSYDMQRSLVHR